MRRIVELDGIRAFAIVAVIACHYYPFSTMLFKAPEFGWAGVELFFVLSGFLITSILLQLKNRPHPYKIFYARRILRIFPPYYAVILLVLVIAVLQHESFSGMRYVGRALFLQSFSDFPAALHTIAHNLSHPRDIPNPFTSTALPRAADRFSVNAFTSSLGPTWSLSVEEWFYILWAPLVLHLRRRTLVYTCLGVCVAAMFIRWFGFLGTRTYFDFFARIDVLLGGALLALWTERRRKLSAEASRRGDHALFAGTAVAFLFLAAILYSIKPILGLEIRESLCFSVFGLPLIGFIFAGLLSYIILHAGSRHLLCRFFRAKVLVELGKISYTLYLVHVPIYFLLNQAAARLGIDPKTYGSALGISTLSALLSICLAKLSFRYYESPILDFKDKLTDRITGQSSMRKHTLPQPYSSPLSPRSDSSVDAPATASQEG